MNPQQKAATWLTNCLILDTETTGLSDSAEIVEISIIDHKGNTVMDTLVKPAHPIPADASRIHGITNEMVAGAPTWPELHEQFNSIITGKTLVIYNADYDTRLIKQTAAQYGLTTEQPKTIECAMLTYAEHYGEWNEHRGNYRWQSLTKAAAQQNVTIQGQAHRALSDCLTTLGVIQAMKA